DPARATPSDPYLALLRVGFAVPVCCQTRGALLPHRFTLATHPRRDRSAVCSLLHFPSARAAQALPGTLPCAARTFLHRLHGSDRPADSGAQHTPSIPSQPLAAVRLAAARVARQDSAPQGSPSRDPSYNARRGAPLS